MLCRSFCGSVQHGLLCCLSCCSARFNLPWCSACSSSWLGSLRRPTCDLIEFDLFCNSACGSAAWFSAFFSSACGSFLQGAVLAFFRICVVFASSVWVAFGVALSFIALVAENKPSKFGALFVSIVPIAADALFVPSESFAPTVVRASSTPLAFSAPFVAICSQAKARFSLGARRLNLALVAAPVLVVFLALATPPSVKFT